MSNKKAQTSEIMVWIVATIIIISILLVFVYVSSLLAQKTKIIKVKKVEIDFKEEIDLFETKNSIAYSLASQPDKKIIKKWEKENGK